MGKEKRAECSWDIGAVVKRLRINQTLLGMGTKSMQCDRPRVVSLESGSVVSKVAKFENETNLLL